jgi:hypothetical protein
MAHCRRFTKVSTSGLMLSKRSCQSLKKKKRRKKPTATTPGFVVTSTTRAKVRLQYDGTDTTTTETIVGSDSTHAYYLAVEKGLVRLGQEAKRDEGEDVTFVNRIDSSFVVNVMNRNLSLWDKSGYRMLHSDRPVPHAEVLRSIVQQRKKLFLKWMLVPRPE